MRIKKIVAGFLLSAVVGAVGLTFGGIVTKPYTFKASTGPGTAPIRSAEVNSNFDTLYNDYNGNITDANISASAAIQQSKISGLAAAIQSIVAKAGDTMTGPLNLKLSVPYLRFIGQETSAKDWRVAENAGKLTVDENTGTEGAPTWTPRYTLAAGAGGPAVGTDLTTKTYVDNTSSSLAIGKMTKSDASVNLTGSFADTGITVTVTTGARRVRVDAILVAHNGSGNNRTHYVDLYMDGAAVTGATSGINRVSVDSNRDGPLGFTWVSNVLTAGSHTFTIFAKTGLAGGTQQILADTDTNAILSVEELSR